MSIKKLIHYGEQLIQGFALTESPDVLYNATPIKHLINYYQIGVIANNNYIWQINENLKGEQLLVIFPINTTPKGTLTLSLSNEANETPELVYQFSMTSNAANNVYAANLAIFFPIQKNKFIKIQSSINALIILFYGQHCHISSFINPILIV